MQVVGNEYILTLNISSDINYSDVVLTFKDTKIKQWATGDTKIQFYDGDKNGTRLHYQTHSIAGENIEGIRISKASRKNDKITIVLDKETANNVITGNMPYNVDYDARFFGGNMQVGFRTKNTNNNLQDYAIITTGNATARSNISWNKSPTPPPNPPTSDKGGLKILKYNAKTNELVAGAIFKIRGISDGVYDFNVQIQASNGAEIPLQNGATVTRRDGVIEIRDLHIILLEKILKV